MTPRFYITAVDGPRVYRLAGPFPTYGVAKAKVDRAREIAMDFTRNSQAGRAAFMGYGVTRIDTHHPLRTALGSMENEQ